MLFGEKFRHKISDKRQILNVNAARTFKDLEVNYHSPSKSSHRNIKTCHVLPQHNLKIRKKQQFSLPIFVVLDAFPDSARSKNDSSLVG